MNKGNSSQRWFTPWRASKGRVDDDPADMGTAFGLDASLNMVVPEPAPAQATVRPRKTWMSKLQLRRKPAI